MVVSGVFFFSSPHKCETSSLPDGLSYFGQATDASSVLWHSTTSSGSPFEYPTQDARKCIRACDNAWLRYRSSHPRSGGMSIDAGDVAGAVEALLGRWRRKTRRSGHRSESGLLSAGHQAIGQPVFASCRRLSPRLGFYFLFRPVSSVTFFSFFPQGLIPYPRTPQTIATTLSNLRAHPSAMF